MPSSMGSLDCSQLCTTLLPLCAAEAALSWTRREVKGKLVRKQS